MELIFGDSSHAPDGVRVMYARNVSGNSALAVLDLLGADAGHVAFPVLSTLSCFLLPLLLQGSVKALPAASCLGLV